MPATMFVEICSTLKMSKSTPESLAVVDMTSSVVRSSSALKKNAPVRHVAAEAMTSSFWKRMLLVSSSRMSAVVSLGLAGFFA